MKPGLFPVLESLTGTAGKNYSLAAVPEFCHLFGGK